MDPETMDAGVMDYGESEGPDPAVATGEPGTEGEPAAPAAVETQPAAPVAQAPEPTRQPGEPAAPAAPATPQPLTSEAYYKQQFDRMSRELSQYQLQQQQAQIEQQVQQQVRSLIDRGSVTEDAAGVLADQLRQAQTQALNVHRQAQNAMLEQEGRMNAALHYAKAYGVDAKDILWLDSPDAMEREAKSQQRVKSLEKEIAELKQGRVAPQTFDNSRSTPGEGGGDQSRIDRLNAKGAWSDEDMAQVQKYLSTGA